MTTLMYLTYKIDSAQPSDIAALADIELAAAEMFPEADIPAALRDTCHTDAFFEDALDRGHLWVARNRDTGLPIGFALVSFVDGAVHLTEMDVLPEFSRRGVGRALVSTVADWAEAEGAERVTLTTFSHLPWNGPFYKRLGFNSIPRARLTPGLRDILRAEADLGLDPKKRVAMQLDLFTM